MSRNVLIVIGVMGLCGLGFITTGWWTGLTDTDRTALFGQTLVAWFCCGGPLLGGLVGYQTNNILRNGWKVERRKVEEL